MLLNSDDNRANIKSIYINNAKKILSIFKKKTEKKIDRIKYKSIMIINIYK